MALRVTIPDFQKEYEKTSQDTGVDSSLLFPEFMSLAKEFDHMFAEAKRNSIEIVFISGNIDTSDAYFSSQYAIYTSGLLTCLEAWSASVN